MLTLLFACCLVTGQDLEGGTIYENQSATIHDSRGQRQGEVRQSGPDRYDLYDAKSNRLGWGQRSPIDGSIQFYDTKGNRTFQVVPDRSRRK